MPSNNPAQRAAETSEESEIHHYSLSLDQSLLIAMDDEGRWMIKNNLTAEKTLPYFGDYIYTEGLEAVKPEAVNIK